MNYGLYFFNPEHDLALANSDPNFYPPESARKFAADLSYLPVWYAPPKSVIYSRYLFPDWFQKIKDQFTQLSQLEISNLPDFNSTTELNPWGWDFQVRKQFKELGIPPELLPEDHEIDFVAKMSHRRTAINALDKIVAEIAQSHLFPSLPVECFSLSTIENYVNKHVATVIKAPWSGSGKGLCWVSDSLSKSDSGWCKNVLNKQKSVILENAYDVIQDFAMEFSCNTGMVKFEGYSLFETNNGIYRGNKLLKDQDIEIIIAQYMSEPDLLRDIKDSLINFIQHEISVRYTGIVGVDMFFYRDNGKIKIHPVVEINLRTTMGFVARKFFDNFVHHTSSGNLFVDYCAKDGELDSDHISRSEINPAKIVDSRLVSGYLSLTPINKDTRYRVRVEILPQK